MTDNTLNWKSLLWLLAGPVAFYLLREGHLDLGLSVAERGVLATTAWMALWWVSEIVPTAVTALLPIALFPLTGVVRIEDTTRHYGHPYIFLFLGGFLLAAGMEKWALHKRIAISIIRAIGTRPDRIVLGFMLATGFVSMWISNTATAVMLMPVATSLLQHRKGSRIPDSVPLADRKREEHLAKALMLGVAYASSIGGIATLIGTPPNLVLAGIWNEYSGTNLEFIDWMLFAFPLCLILLLGTWWYLTHMAFPVYVRRQNAPAAAAAAADEVEVEGLGPIQANEKKVLWVFVAMVLAWVFRSILIEPWLPAFDDTLIALCGGLLLFLIPSTGGKGALLDWDDTRSLPWGILLLFGGGMALAHGFEQSGLATRIGETLVQFRGIHPLLFVFMVVVGMSLLTEFTSNLAATTMILPVLLPVAAGLNQSPLYLLSAASMAASCAFMMPVSTPPNAVVFSTGQLKVRDMAMAGIFVNILSALLIGFGIYYYMPLIFQK